MRPNLPGLACHMINRLASISRAEAICGRVVPDEPSRATLDPTRVSCGSCLRGCAGA